jgi:hypothetical protein
MAALTSDVVRPYRSLPELSPAEIHTILQNTTIYQGAVAMQVAGKARPCASGVAGSVLLGVALRQYAAPAGADLVLPDGQQAVFLRGVFPFAGLAGDLPTEALIDVPGGVAFADDNTVKATAAANDCKGTLRAITEGSYFVEIQPAEDEETDMSSSLTTVVSNSDVDFFFTSVNLAYLRALKGFNKAVYPSLCYVPPAKAMVREKVGITLPDGTQGSSLRIKFPVSVAASAPEEWPYGVPRTVEPFSQVTVEVDMKRWAPPSKREQYDVFGADTYGIIQDQLPQMMDRSLILWDRVLATRMVENGPAYDGISFFTSTTPHQANPFKPGIGTFLNDFAITGIDVPEMRRMLGILENMPGPDGLPLDSENVEIIAVAPTSDMELQLLQVFQGAIAAQPVGANAAAGVSNSLVGRARVQLFKQLARTKNLPVYNGTAQDRTKVGYLLAVPAGGEGRPFAVVPSRQPTAYYTGFNGSDHLRATNGAVEFGWDALGNAKLVLPQRALRFVVSPV